MFWLWGTALLYFALSVEGHHYWTLPESQDLFRTLLSNVKECQYTVEETFPAISSANPFQLGMVQQKVNFTYFGVCAPDVESCIHLGATPYRVVDKLPKEICGVCCARRSCHDFYPEFQKPKEKFQRNGICLLPKILSVNNSDQTDSMEVVRFPKKYCLYVDFVQVHQFDDEETKCFGFGGQLKQAYANNNRTIWWDIQCPMSGRCCLFPERDQCDLCGQKSGKTWNFSRSAVGRSSTDDDILAWKTAVHQMAGTGWNLGMQPISSPGFAEQYSQIPPSYESTLLPQMWNTGLNILGANKDTGKKVDEEDDDDEDDFKGWCWQGAMLSKLNGNLRCGAVLVADKFLLTTAACVNFTVGTFMDYKIRLGGTDLRKVSEKHAVDHDIAAIHIYPSYNPANFDHNIALVELHSNVVCDGKYTCTLCLPSPFIMNFGNLSMSVEHQQWIRDDVTQCVVTGWGPKGTGTNVSFLKEMPYLPVYRNSSFCESNMRNMKGVQPDYTLPNNSFCAASQPFKQGKTIPACHGDAGNPMACWYGGSFYLTGLLSDFNVQRCDSGKIGNIVAKILQPHKTEEARQLNLNVFTDVAQFIPWINKVVHGLD